MSSSSQWYSQAMEKYEYTTAMLVKVVRVENKAHTGFVRLKQYTTAMLTRVENTALVRRSWLLQVPLLLDIYYETVYVIVPGT